MLRVHALFDRSGTLLLLISLECPNSLFTFSYNIVLSFGNALRCTGGWHGVSVDNLDWKNTRSSFPLGAAGMAVCPTFYDSREAPQLIRYPLTAITSTTCPRGVVPGRPFGKSVSWKPRLGNAFPLMRCPGSDWPNNGEIDIVEGALSCTARLVLSYSPWSAQASTWPPTTQFPYTLERDVPCLATVRVS